MDGESIILSEDSVLRKILHQHVLQLFKDREKSQKRRSFSAVIRQGGFRVVISRKLRCCDIIIFETTLAPDDKVDERIVAKCIDEYIRWELRLENCLLSKALTEAVATNSIK